MMLLRRFACMALLAAVAAAVGGCQSGPQGRFDQPLPEGQQALERVPDHAWPDLWPAIDPLLEPASMSRLREAARRSAAWFDLPSTRQHFPVAGITQGRARASAKHFSRVIHATHPDLLPTVLRRDFHLYRSVGARGEGQVLFTGYYAPEFEASLERTERFKYPLYTRPPDLVSDPDTGEILGRRGAEGQLTPYPSRAEIEANPAVFGLAGQELVWLKDRFDAYAVHVNGSAKLTLPDGRPVYVGYAGTNGRPYTSVGELLVQDGLIPADRVSMSSIRRFARRHPLKFDRYARQNERFVFFRFYQGEDWPSGSLGFPVTAYRTLATDKAIFPRGCPVLVDTEIPGDYPRRHAADEEPSDLDNEDFRQFMFDQDTGGAIRAAGRADIYMGEGPAAARYAGRQRALGQLYYFIVKPELVGRFDEVAAGEATP